LDSIDNFAFLSTRERRRKQDNFMSHFHNFREDAMQMFFGTTGSRVHAVSIIYNEDFQAIT
jgi:hypothetical protein